MKDKEITLLALDQFFAICQLAPTEDIPNWATRTSKLISITWTNYQ